jgi:atrial natriuretic peptide receptor A
VPGTPATQKGDVYSFAIVLEEIGEFIFIKILFSNYFKTFSAVIRGGPYDSVRQFMTITSILDRVAAHENPPFR